MHKRLLTILPVILTLPVIAAIIWWNLRQADHLAHSWHQREAMDTLREILVEYRPELRSWLNDPLRFADQLATSPVRAAGLKTSSGWTFSPASGTERELLERTIAESSDTYRLVGAGMSFLRLSLRAGPPAAGEHPGGWGRGDGRGPGPGRGMGPGSRGGAGVGKNRHSGNGFGFENAADPEDSGDAVPAMPAGAGQAFSRGPFEVAVVLDVAGTPPVLPFRLQGLFWFLAWLGGSLLWLWYLRAQRHMQTMNMERQREAHLAAVGRMSARLAHEIRNPLGMIRGAAQHVRNIQLPTAERQELLAMIEDESRRLEALSREVLEFCRPFEVHLTPVDVPALLRDLQFQANLVPEQARVQLGQLPESCIIQADADALRQVLLNLLKNAREAMGSQHPGVVLVGAQEQGDVVTITIRDTGPGLTSESQEHLFEPFFSGKPQGFGLGLAISQRLVELQGGHLMLSNHPDGGCQAEVQLGKN